MMKNSHQREGIIGNTTDPQLGLKRCASPSLSRDSEASISYSVFYVIPESVYHFLFLRAEMKLGKVGKVPEWAKSRL